LSFLAFFRRTYSSYNRHNPSRFGAALAFYFVFAVGPTVVLLIKGASEIFGPALAERHILSLAANFFGDAAAAAVTEIVKAAAAPNSGWLAAAIGFSGLFFGVSGMYRQIRDALRAIWHIEPAAPVGWVAKLTHRLTSIALVLGVSLLLALSALADAAIAFTGRYAQSQLAGGELLWHAVQLSLSALATALLFAAIFRYLPKTPILWRDVAVAAAVTAVLFVLGKFLLGLYLGKAAVGSRYGAAGSVVVVMVWAYWSAQIFFFGLELTHMYADRHHEEQRAAEDRRKS